MAQISIIVAVTRNNAIGRKGDLLFHISDDLRRFKAITMGCPIIMGRKTFESFPKGPLPGRRNIVITRQADYAATGIEVVGSLDQALALVAVCEKAFVIGGGQIYEQAIAVADMLHLTEIDADIDDADTFFPAINPDEWVRGDEECHHDDKSGVDYRFVCLSRK